MKSLLRYTVDDFLLLPLGGLLALVWANAAPESYFSVARPLTFWVNDVAMTLFFALIAQEVLEEVMPGGALHSWRRWLLPLAAAAGSMGGAALLYLTYVTWNYELVLRDGWPAATAIDIAVVYVLVRALFRRHAAVAFVLVTAVAVDIAGLALVASRQHLVHVETGGASMMLTALGLGAIMRVLNVVSFWPYLIVCGPLSWWALYVSGIHPALALVPVMLFVKHTPRSLVLFEDHPHTAHQSMTHFEHVFMYPVHGVLFLFGLVNAGVLLSGYGTGTWALLLASLIGKPLGLLLGTAAGVAVGLHLPRGLHWRDLGVVAVATAGGFAFALFFASAVFPAGPLLGELKLGVILSGIGVPIAIGAAWVAKVGRFHTHPNGRRHAHARHAVAGLLVAAVLLPSAGHAQQSGDVSMVFQRHVDAFMALRQRAREGVAPDQILNPRIRAISGALLAARVRELRPEATEGEVFTAAMSALIRERLRRAFDPREVDGMLSQLYLEGTPAFTEVRINHGCARDVLVAPPVGVLGALPPLPGVLGYRLAGRDLVMWDEEAEIVIDVVREALPAPRVWDFLDVSSFELRQRIRHALETAGLNPIDLREEMDDDAPADWRPVIGEPFCWDASGVMPPTLLHALPDLPKPLEYRFVVSDLVVVNVDNGFVEGVLYDALPRRATAPRT
jgi:NhaA family Na+:H+ antiporter